MKKDKAIAIFEGSRIRRHWDEKDQKWYFSVVDIVEALTDSLRPSAYWTAMKARVKNEDEIQLSTICRQLKSIQNVTVCQFL